MHKIVLALAALGFATGLAGQVMAHGDAPHPKCKKGYVLTDDHKCVKK